MTENCRRTLRRYGLRVLRLVAIALPFVVTGCAASRAVKLEIAPETGERTILPQSPATPRMRYLYSIRTPKVPARREKADSFLSGINRGGEMDAQEEQFGSPMAITEAPAGMFHVLDQAHSTLLSVQPEQKRWRQIELAAGEPLASLVGITADRNGSLYLTDSVLGKIFLLSATNGKLADFAASHKFSRPTGIVHNPVNNQVYVTDTLRHKVVVFDLAGNELREFGQRGNLPGEFNYPTYLAVDREGNLYVADTLNFRVQSFTADGRYRFSFGNLGDGPGEFTAPKGVAISPTTGIIYVVDGRSDRVSAFSPQGDFLFAFGDSGSAPGQFWSPTGIYVDARDRVYVCDYLNNRVQVFQYLGDKL